jgi:hypothetical protein
MARNRVRKLHLDIALRHRGQRAPMLTFQLPVQIPTQRGDALALTSK